MNDNDLCKTGQEHDQQKGDENFGLLKKKKLKI